MVISLDPPIRKGQTFYPHILVQLPTDDDVSINLEIEDEQLTEKNAKVSKRRACKVSEELLHETKNLF